MDGAREHDGCALPGDLITFGEIREALGVGRTRGYTITRDRDFPTPWFTSGDGTVRLWRRSDVEAWFAVHRPGSPEGPTR